MRTLSLGFFAFSFFSWLKLPAIGWPQASATPSTEVFASKLFW